jgi:hypothetical protein
VLVKTNHRNKVLGHGQWVIGKKISLIAVNL